MKQLTYLKMLTESKTVSEVLSDLNVNASNGLTDEEVKKRQSAYGKWRGHACTWKFINDLVKMKV